MPSVLIKVTTAPPKPPSSMVSSDPFGGQVWVDYVWDATQERWRGVNRVRPAPARQTVPTPRPPAIVVKPPQMLTPLPAPTVRDPFGVLPGGATASQVEAMQRAYQARYAAWRAANPGASILDFPG